MDYANLFISVVGVIYMVYSILCRNKITVYNRSNRMEVLQKERFLKLQLHFAIINSVLLVSCGLILAIYNLEMRYGLILIILFHIINYIFKTVARRKGYVRYN